jgi:hypothetical protein
MILALAVWRTPLGVDGGEICIQNGVCAFAVDQQQLFREAMRVTRSGGLVFFFEPWIKPIVSKIAIQVGSVVLRPQDESRLPAHKLLHAGQIAT